MANWERLEWPNPLAFLRSVAWHDLTTQRTGAALGQLEHLNRTYPCPTGCVHNDLNTANIICPTRWEGESTECPNFIDIADSRPDGIPLYDLAYLELDILLQSIPPSVESNKQIWLNVLAALMDGEIVPSRHASFSRRHERALALTLPIREGVQRIFDAVGNLPGDHPGNYMIWWAATVAAGLNFASKRAGMTTEKRQAALLYAAHGLRCLLTASDDGDFAPAADPPVVLRWFLSGRLPNARTSLGREAVEGYATLLETSKMNKHKILSVHVPKSPPTLNLQERLPELIRRALSQRRDSMVAMMAELGYNVTTCVEADMHTSNCCSCRYAERAGAVVLLLDENLEARMVSVLLSQMKVPPNKALVMVPEALGQMQPRAQSRFKADIVRYLPEAPQQYHIDTDVPVVCGDDLCNNYVIARALQWAGHRSGKMGVAR